MTSPYLSSLLANSEPNEEDKSLVDSEIYKLHKGFTTLDSIKISIDHSKSFKMIEKYLATLVPTQMRKSMISEASNEEKMLARMQRELVREEMKDDDEPDELDDEEDEIPIDLSIEKSEKPMEKPPEKEKISKSSPTKPKLPTKIKYKFFVNGEEITNKSQSVVESLLQQVIFSA
jgi:hypothetical protein